MNLYKKITSKIIGNKEDFSVHYQIFNATLFAGIVLTLVSAICNYYMDLKPFTYIFPFANIFLFIGFHLYSLLKKNFYLISRVSFAYILFVYVPINWFINAGSQGGFHYFSIFFLIVLITTMPGKKVVFLVLYFLTIISILCCEYFFPQLVFNYPARIDRYIDLIISYSLLYLAILVVINIFLKLYKEANNILTKQKEEIQISDKELKIVNKKLEEINLTKDKFFSIIAHDLKGPFNSMLGFSKLLSENYNEFTEEEKIESIRSINTSAQNTYKLLENLLIWSRSQRETIDFFPKDENLFLLSSEVIDLMHLSAKRKLIKIRKEISHDITINADKYMFSTILRNLLSNAIKFTPKNGEIEVKAKKIENEFIQISVKDNGIGISKEIQSRLFDISKNSSTKGTENETGTGLGLILCKEFTEKHGGKIWVESKINNGSKICFTIPLKS